MMKRSAKIKIPSLRKTLILFIALGCLLFFFQNALIIKIEVLQHKYQDTQDVSSLTLKHVLPYSMNINTFSPNIAYLPMINLPPYTPSNDTIHISSTILSGKSNEVTVRLISQMMKSVVMFHHSDNNIIFHIVIDNITKELIQQDLFLHSLNINYYYSNLDTFWNNLFAQGSAQRLFLHTLLPNSISKVIYIDIDTIITRDISDLWSLFNTFTFQEMIGATRESEILDSYYVRYADPKLPHCDEVGINAGILLLDLDKLRNLFTPSLIQIFNEIAFHYQNLLYVGDQDILNVFCYNYPDKIKLLPCYWNVREDSWCRVSNINELGIIHGSRGRLDKGKSEHHWIYEFSAIVRKHPLLENQWNFQYPNRPLRLS